MNRRTASRSPNWVLAACAASLVVAGCAAEDPLDMASTGSGSGTPLGAGGSGAGGDDPGQGGASSEGDVLVGACPTGSLRDCKVHHDGGCFSGRQYCVDGSWSGCERAVDDGDVPRSLDDPALACGDGGTTENTCDPECQAFDPDAPDFGSGSSATPGWETGDLGDLPADVIEDGLEEPCNDGRDCQFDHYCDETTDTCKPYVPGQALTACESGPANRPDLSLGVPCGDTVPICNRGPVTMTAAQMGEVELEWRDDPNPSMEGCNIGASTVCDVPAVELAPGECISVACSMPEDVYVFADWGANDECECGNNWTYNVDSACGEPSCGGSVSTASEVPLTLFVAVDRSLSMQGSRWNAIRPGLVSFFQDAGSDGLGVVLKLWPNDRCASSACDTDAPYVEQGTCAKHPCDFWVTGTGNAATLDAACDPVVADMCDETTWRRCCNTGSGTKRWDALCAEEYSRRAGYACGIRSTCRIDPCESFASGTGADVTLDAACHPTVADMCDEAAWDQCCNAGTSGTRRWSSACASEFAARTGGSDGLCFHKTCDHGDMPGIADGIEGYRLELDAAAAPADTAESQLVAAVNSVTSFPGQTPFTAVLRGGVDYCRDYMAKFPDERCLVVMATDADIGPSGPGLVCGTSLGTALAAAETGTDDGILTYVIGVEGSTQTYLDQLADAGGTGSAFILGGGADAADDLIEAFETIRNAFACSYAVDDAVDPELVSLVWNDGGSDPAITRVADVTQCGTAPGGLGYYFSASDQVTLCPDTCEAVKAEPDTNVALEIACASAPEPVELVEEFTAEGACPDAGTYPQWTFLLYTADVPTGSSIVVDAQTRFDDASAWGGWTPIVTIDESNETSDLADPTSLSEPLGVASFAESIRIRMRSTVDGGAPTMTDYEVQFSCVDTE